MRAFATGILCLAISSSTTFAEKSEHCPTVEQIDIVNVREPNIYTYQAVNGDGKLFTSLEYGGNYNNGPAPALYLIDSSYEDSTKELTCIYFAYSTYGNPRLTNVGDY